MDREAFFKKAEAVREGQPFHSAQLDAIGAGEGPMLIEAGPGSGKTTVLVWRLVYMLTVMKTPADRICVVTFTNSAADEMKARLGSLTRRARGLLMGTIHSLARAVLDEAGFEPGQALSPERQLRAVRQLLRRHNIRVTPELPSQFIGEVDAFRNRLQTPREHVPTTIRNGPLREPETFAKLAEQYVEHLRHERQKDYDGWLEQLYDVLHRRPEAIGRRFDYILIDEFQDTSLLQYEVLRKLSSGDNLYVVGDQDQSIYGWRGAGPEVFRGFVRDYPEAGRVVLDVNYRATSALVDRTNRLIACNKQREPKEMKAHESVSEDAPVVIRPGNDAEEATDIGERLARAHRDEGVPWREMAVIYRRNEQALAFIGAFGRLGLPFEILGNPPSPFHSWVGDDVLTYLRLGADARETELLERIIYRPKRFISRAATRTAARFWREGTSLSQAFSRMDLRASQRERIAQLERDLAHIGTLSPAEAVRYIRREVAYDEYLSEQSEGSETEGSDLLARAVLIEVVAAGFDTVSDFVEFALAVKRDPTDWWKRFVDRRNGGRGDAIRLTTCHSAKGLEFDVVAVVGLVDDILPGSGADEEEERRLAYVAMTRARRTLLLSAPRALLGDGRTPSPFVKEATGIDLAAQGRSTSEASAAARRTSRGASPRDGSRARVAKRSGAARGGRPTQQREAKAEVERGAAEVAALAERLRPGASVRHNRFGVGEVKEVREQGGTMTVSFPKEGDKIFVIDDVLRRHLMHFA